jgi:hypothetical protein
METILSTPPVAARLPWRVTRLEWSAQGGPRRAWMQAALPPGLHPLGTDLCRGLLGGPLTVIDGDGAPCWWGYAHAVTQRAVGLAQRLSLDGLVNRAAGLYERPGGELAQTDWAEDAESVRTWGRHEKLLRQAGGADETLAARDALLARSSQPRWAAAAAPVGEATLEIEARGWWETLDWTNYAPSGGRVEHVFSAGGGQPVGAQAANSGVAQSFRLVGESWPVGEVWLRVGKRGSPADGLRLELCGDAGGVPGAPLASSEVGAEAVPFTTGWLRFALPGPTLATDAAYWLVLRRTGATDALNYFLWQADEQQGYPGGECRLWDGQAWSVRQPPCDLGFRVDGTQTMAELVAALAAQNPHLSGTRFENAASQTVLRWRDGWRSCLQELLAGLAAAGLLAEVEADRRLAVRTRPPESAAAAWFRGGEIVEFSGRAWNVSRPLAGRWVKAGEASVWVDKAVWEGGSLDVEG